MAEEVKEEQPHVHGENCHHDHEHSHEEHDHEHEHEHEGEDGDLKSNRGEKKFKKAMTKMGLKPVTGINRVTIKKGKAFVISIDDPDVWKTPGNENSYIIFGKPNMDGLQTGQNEINQFKNPVTPEGAEEAKVEAPSAETAAKVEVTAEDLDETGLTPDNIKMVVEYTQCTRAEAIKALRESGDDSVNAIMKLTK
jgi:nascent polypeptide-associated complex subunit alpha